MGEKKTKRTPICVYHSSGEATAARKACTQPSGHSGGGVSINIAAHLGSNELHRFSLHIINLWNIIPFTSNTPHSDSQLRRLGPAGEGTYYHVTSSEGRFPWCEGPMAKAPEASILHKSWLGSEYQNQEHFINFQKKVEHLYWVFLPGSSSPHVMSLLALHWFLPSDTGLTKAVYRSQGFAPKLPL